MFIASFKTLHSLQSKLGRQVKNVKKKFSVKATCLFLVFLYGGLIMDLIKKIKPLLTAQRTVENSSKLIFIQIFILFSGLVDLNY